MTGVQTCALPISVRAGKPVEVDGNGGLAAVAGVWALAESERLGRAVAIADVSAGTLRAAQAELDAQLEL